MKTNYFLKSLVLFSASLFTFPSAFAQCTSCGTGSNGAYAPASSTTLAGGTYNYTSFTINNGVIITVTGNAPLVINCTGKVTINGTLNANGGNGGNGVTSTSAGIAGLGVAGGANGGMGAFSSTTGPISGVTGSGPGAGGQGLSWSGGGGAGYSAVGSSATTAEGVGGPVYGNAQINPVVAGSGGGGGSGGQNCGSGGGGGGGGIINFNSCDTITVGATGVIEANGGTGGSDGLGNCGGGGGGSGGSIWISCKRIVNNGSLSAIGGTGGASNIPNTPYFGVGGAGASGRVRLDYASMGGTGTVTPASGFTAPPLTVTYTQNPNNVCSNAAAFTLSPGTPNGGTYSGTAVTGNMFNPTTAGVGTFPIIYSYTDVNSCTASATQNIVVSVCTGIQSLDGTSNPMIVFPNPFSGNISLSFNTDGSERLITVYDMVGKAVYHSKTTLNSLELDLSFLEKGSYMIQVKTENEYLVRRIIKD
jgi:hypothetical protein